MIQKETRIINSHEVHLFFDTEQQAYLVASDAMEVFLDSMQKTKQYEDAEENGLLIRLPCRVGDPVYRIMGDNFIMKSIVEEFVFTNIVYVVVRDELFNTRRGIPYCEMGKTMFLTKEEAETICEYLNVQEGAE